MNYSSFPLLYKCMLFDKIEKEAVPCKRVFLYSIIGPCNCTIPWHWHNIENWCCLDSEWHNKENLKGSLGPLEFLFFLSGYLECSIRICWIISLLIQEVQLAMYIKYTNWNEFFYGFFCLGLFFFMICDYRCTLIIGQKYSGYQEFCAICVLYIF